MYVYRRDKYVRIVEDYTKKEGEDITITSLYTINQQEYFEIYAPVEAQLNMDDLLVRIMYDPNSDRPYIMILQVL